MAVDIQSQQREVRVHSLGDTSWRKVLTPDFHIMVGGTVNWLACPTLDSSNIYYKYDETDATAADQLVIFSVDLKS
ncbi:hypothetical protein Fmac_019026 [Flemingia macrophylla]|uniref:F-box protein n=1 Tax=Flemingia macrophylla TaxID=520843 RepID=A0ABD1M8L8_9FABA